MRYAHDPRAQKCTCQATDMRNERRRAFFAKEAKAPSGQFVDRRDQAKNSDIIRILYIIFV
jgi:hypothetical protein